MATDDDSISLYASDNDFIEEEEVDQIYIPVVINKPQPDTPNHIIKTFSKKFNKLQAPIENNKPAHIQTPRPPSLLSLRFNVPPFPPPRPPPYHPYRQTTYPRNPPRTEPRLYYSYERTPMPSIYQYGKEQ